MFKLAVSVSAVASAAVCAALVVSCVGDEPGTPTDAGSDAPTVAPNDAGGGTTPEAGPNEASVAGTAIDGHVTDVYARPVPGATVRVGSATANTDTSGTFHLDAVAPTYDLEVLAPSTLGGKTITSFRGLTTRTPEANVEGFYELRNAPLGGKLEGLAPLGASEHVRISGVDRKTGFDYESVETDQLATWTGQTSWVGATTSSMTFWILRFTSPDGTEGTPSVFSGYAQLSRELTDGRQDTTLQTGLNPITTAHLLGSVKSLPEVAASALVFAVVKNANDRYGHALPVISGINNTFSIPTPSGANLSVNVVGQTGGNIGQTAEDHFAWKANQAPDATGVTFTFGTAPRVVTPKNGATGVKSDQLFSWSAGSPAGVYELGLRCGDGAAEYAATVYTTTMSATLPDASSLGSPWPVGATCQWSIRLYQTITAVDAIVAAAGARTALDHPNGPNDGAYASSSGYQLTTP